MRSSLLTGLPVADGPVLAVKIDNTAPARPRVGLGSADVVYVEPVEGGLTRLNAVFSTRMPAEVGPVRSGRVSDASILASYGQVAFAYSGASSYTNARLGKAPLVNVSMDSGGTGYRRERSRRGPYNVIADPAALLRRAGGSVPPNDVGFTFGALPAGGAPVRIATTKYASATISFAWSRQQRRWVLSTDGTPDVDPSGNQHGATTVVFQHVQVVASDNRDSTGARTPDVVLTGSGTAEVLRDGVAFSAQWSRRAGAGPTSFSGTAPRSRSRPATCGSSWWRPSRPSRSPEPGAADPACGRSCSSRGLPWWRPPPGRPAAPRPSEERRCPAPNPPPERPASSAGWPRCSRAA